MNRKAVFQRNLIVLAITFFVAKSEAQVSGYLTGYLNGEPTITSFSTSTALFERMFINAAGRGSTFAVSSDGSTLYMPYSAGTDGQSGALDVVSAETGLTIQSIPLAYPAMKVLLSGDGLTAYVLTRGQEPLGEVDVVTLSTGQVTETLRVSSLNSYLLDIAVSPDGGKLFLALQCANSEECNSKQPAPCTISYGMCIYDAKTLAFESQVPYLYGMLSISLDGNSLYVVENTRTAVYVLDTQTLTVSVIHTTMYAQGPPVINPQGTYAVLFVKGSANILNTITNQFVGKFLASLPGGSSASSEDFNRLGNLAAFAPDGKSLWVVLSCPSGGNCSLPKGATMALAGFNFPSGTLIGERPLPILDPLIPNLAIAFPQVLTPPPAE